MVDIRTRHAQPTQPAADLNPRGARVQRRLAILKEERERAQHASVRVVPTNEKYRGVLKHMPSGIRFRSSGGIEWPNDRFTQRRLRDGSVKLEPKKETKDEQQPRRSTSAPAPSGSQTS